MSPLSVNFGRVLFADLVTMPNSGLRFISPTLDKDCDTKNSDKLDILLCSKRVNYRSDSGSFVDKVGVVRYV